jgi:hypothetical protein
MDVKGIVVEQPIRIKMLLPLAEFLLLLLPKKLFKSA